jgi:hypothetical protein
VAQYFHAYLSGLVWRHSLSSSMCFQLGVHNHCSVYKLVRSSLYCLSLAVIDLHLQIRADLPESFLSTRDSTHVSNCCLQRNRARTSWLANLYLLLQLAMSNDVHWRGHTQRRGHTQKASIDSPISNKQTQNRRSRTRLINKEGQCSKIETLLKYLSDYVENKRLADNTKSKAM